MKTASWSRRERLRKCLGWAHIVSKAAGCFSKQGWWHFSHLLMLSLTRMACNQTMTVNSDNQPSSFKAHHTFHMALRYWKGTRSYLGFQNKIRKFKAGASICLTMTCSKNVIVSQKSKHRFSKKRRREGDSFQKRNCQSKDRFSKKCRGEGVNCQALIFCFFGPTCVLLTPLGPTCCSVTPQKTRAAASL